MKKKRIAILTVISIMVVSGLTGCGQKVTAENLLDGAYGSKKVESMDADLSMNADADIDISDLLEDTAEQSADAAGSTTMNFKVAMDCNIKATEKNCICRRYCNSGYSWYVTNGSCKKLCGFRQECILFL